MNAIYPLFSSSKGNSVFIGNSHRGILIDCGVSCKRLDAAMKRNGLDMSAVKAVFITLIQVTFIIVLGSQVALK